MFTFPRTTTIRELQRNYKKIFEMVKRTKEPIVVIKNNKPDVAIVDVKALKDLDRKLEQLELADAIRSIKQGEKEYGEGRGIKAKSLADLM